MSSIESILCNEIQKGIPSLWMNAWDYVIHERIAIKANSLIDYNIGRLKEEWLHLDDNAYIIQIIANNIGTIQERCADVLLAIDDPEKSKSIRRDFNTAIQNGGHGSQGAKSLHAKLMNALNSLIASSIKSAFASYSPFPKVWGILSSIIEKEIVFGIEKTTSTPVPEWWILNRSTLAAYFRTSSLPNAKAMFCFFSDWSKKPLSVRGSLVKIVESIPENMTYIPQISNRTGGVRLSTRNLSDLLEIVENESLSIEKGLGFMHRMLSAKAKLDPSLENRRENVSNAQLHQARDYSYRLYEYTILFYATISSVEQLLRALAERQAPKIQHIKDGKPLGVNKWYKSLNLPKDVLDEVAFLYDNDSYNIRNRVMHSALLDVDSARIESHVYIANPLFFPSFSTRTACSPENIAQLCLSCIEKIDDYVVSSSPICPSDFAWTSALNLTPDEIDFGNTLPCEMLGLDAIAWLLHLSDYLSAMFPCLSQLFRIGMVGWSDHTSSDSLVRFMGQGLIFEAIYRLTVHLCTSENILQISKKGSGSYHFQYKMLDDRQTGICTDKTIDTILSCFSESERLVAKKVLRISFKARNALAHGAIIRFDQRTISGIGHLFIKSIQGLVTAGIHHMNRENAYYRYRIERYRDDNLELADWLAAENQIMQLITACKG